MRAIFRALAAAALCGCGCAFTTGLTTGTLSSSRRFDPSLKLTRIGASPRLNRRARTFMSNSEPAVSDASSPGAVDGVDAAPIGEADALVSDAPEEKTTVAAQTDAESAALRIEQSGEDDIIRRFVKRREDWWEAGVASPFAGLGEDDDVINQLIEKLPLPSYFFLLTSTVLAIAFVGCIFQVPSWFRLLVSCPSPSHARI